MVNAKGFAGVSLFLALGLLTSCSKQQDASTGSAQTPIVESFPISTGELKNCHFQNKTVTYSMGSKITPNPIVCDQGVATNVELISQTALPTGMQFTMGQLSLTGTPNQKIAATNFQFYIENDSGYLILPITITVQ